MKKVYHMVALAVLMTPMLARAQDQGKVIPTKQKAWLVSNFRTGLSDCAIVPLKEGVGVSGTGTASFDNRDGDGLAFSIMTAAGIAPTVTALAIKTKGTSAQRQRALDQACSASASPDGTASSASGPTCAVSGSPETPEVRFMVPLATFDDVASAKAYVGTVTIVNRADADAAIIVHFMAKKGYEYYQAQRDRAARPDAADPIAMTVVAACDTSGLSAKSDTPVAHYDLAVGKKI